MSRSIVGTLAVLAAVGSACKKSQDVVPRTDAADAGTLSAAPLGPLQAPDGIVEYAIYFLPEPKLPAAAAANEVIAKHATLHLVAALAKDMPRPAVAILTPSLGTYAPPDAAGIALFGVGLSGAEAAALPDSPEVLVLTFVSEAKDTVALNREAMAVMDEIVSKTGGVIWDELTRQVFGVSAWRARAAQAAADPPDLGGVITSHAYQADAGPLVRVVSLGMDKLGRPDLVIEDVPQGFVHADDLLAVVAQLLAEGAVPDAQGRLTVDLGAIRNPAASQRLRGVAGPKPRAAVVELHLATPQDGDGQNRLWEITFPGTGSIQERQAAVLAAVFDETDEIVGVPGDDAELREASARAREALMALKPKVVAGLPEREHLTVKAPFDADGGGHEYMWIEVAGWSGTKIRGILLDAPTHVSSLKAGATVEVAEDVAFDYKLTHADGTVEGGETSRILERR